MTLRQLEILAAVKECGTLTEAAEKLYISQPSLSTALKELEKELGVLLVHRDHSGVEFTAVGEEAYTYSQRILEKIGEIRAIPSDEESAKDRSMTLASNFFGGTSFLAETILALQKSCQECYRYQFANTVERQPWEMLLQNLMSGRLDFALVGLDDFREKERLQQINEAELRFEELYSEPYCIVVNAGHPLMGKPITILDLAQYPYVAENHKFNSYIASVYGESFMLKNMVIVESQTGIYHYLAHTDAFSVRPKFELEQNNQLHGLSLFELEVSRFNWSRQVGYILANRNIGWIEDLFINKLMELSLTRQ